jgi:hypothetical protein
MTSEAIPVVLPRAKARAERAVKPAPRRGVRPLSGLVWMYLLSGLWPWIPGVQRAMFSPDRTRQDTP